MIDWLIINNHCIVRLWATSTGLESTMLYSIHALYHCISDLFAIGTCANLLKIAYKQSRKTWTSSGGGRKKKGIWREGQQSAFPTVGSDLTPGTHVGSSWISGWDPYGLPGGYPHTGPVRAPRTKSHGSHVGIQSGTRIRDVTGPRSVCWLGQSQ